MCGAAIRIPLLALALVACSDPADVITFVQPELVTLQDGDTVEGIAREYGVPVDHLMQWNGIRPGDSLNIGAKIVVFQFADDEVTLASLEAGSNPQTRSTPSSTSTPTSSRTKRRARSSKPRGPVLKVAPTVLAVEPLSPNRSGRRVNVDLSGTGRVDRAGVLGAIDGMDLGSTDGLADAAANMQRRSGPSGGMGLGNSNSLAGGGSAETLDHVADTRVLGHTQGGAHGDLSGIRVPKLRKPSPKTCLRGPTEADLKSDDGYVMAKGLTADQVRGGMARIVRHTLSCIPRGTIGEVTVTVEVTVGCNGLVTDVWLANSGGMPGPVTSCVAQTVSYASFPAHALPDGAVFQYPITYRF